MSSSTLTTIQSQLNLYGHSIFMFVGNIGNLLIVMVFSQRRKTACSIYLISAGVVNFIFLILNAYFRIFPFDYSDETTGATIFCKVFAYLLNIFGQVARTFNIFACIDRFLITSDRASFRAFTTIKRAKYLIFFTFIFWPLLALHVPIMRTVAKGRCASSGIYSTMFTIIFVGFIPISLSAIFGYLSYRNMRKMQTRVQPIAQNTTGANNSSQRRDRDLLIIVIAELVTYVVTSTPYPLILLEITASQSVLVNKSVQHSQIETFIVNIAYLLLVFNSAVPFYTYSISSKAFRQDVKKLFINIYCKITEQIPVENVSTAIRSLAQRQTQV